MRIMADRAVLMCRRGSWLDLLVRMTFDTELIGSAGEQKRLFTAVGIMTEFTTSLLERLMPMGLLPLGFDGAVTGVATRGAGLPQQLGPISAVRIMAGRAAAGNEGAMQARLGQNFVDLLVTVGAEQALLFDQQPLIDAFVRQVTTETVAALRRLMINPPVGGIIGVTIEAELIS